MKRAIWISAVALLALGACGKKGGDVTEVAMVKPVPTTAAPAGPLTPPPRKPGLWTQTVAMAEMHQTTKLCLDASTDKQMAWWGSQAAKSTCQEQTITPHLGGGWDFHSVCASPAGGSTSSTGTATGDFGSHYKVEVNSVTTGGPMPQANGAHKIAIEATWQGPCPADMRAGDMEMPGGMRINMNDMMSGKGGGMSGGHSSADIARMRAQAMEMSKAAKGQ